MKRLLFLILLFMTISCKVVAWDDKTSDVYWYAGEADWDGTKWESHDYGSGQWVVLWAEADWPDGYRPDKVKISFTNSESGVVDYDIGCEGPEFVSVENVASGTIQTMDYSVIGEYCQGISLLRVFSKNTEQAFQVTKIEFGFSSSVQGARLQGASLQ